MQGTTDARGSEYAIFATEHGVAPAGPPPAPAGAPQAARRHGEGPVRAAGKRRPTKKELRVYKERKEERKRTKNKWLYE